MASNVDAKNRQKSLQGVKGLTVFSAKDDAITVTIAG